MLSRRKRISTWVNLIQGVVAAAMVFIPEIGLAAVVQGKVMLVFSVLIAIAQWYKQKEVVNVKPT